LAPHQAKPGLFSGGVSSNKGTSCKQVSPAGIQRLRLARHSGCPRNPVSTGSIANLDWRTTPWVLALWAPWEGAAAAAIFSLGVKSLRPKSGSVNPKPPPKHFVKSLAQPA